MPHFDFARKTSLVTGASSGLGLEFARQLAARGSNLVLVARSADRLEALADEMQARYEVTATALPADLSLASDVSRVPAFRRVKRGIALVPEGRGRLPTLSVRGRVQPLRVAHSRPLVLPAAASAQVLVRSQGPVRWAAA